MTQEERDNLLLGLKNGQDKLLGRVDDLEKGQEKIIGRMDKLEDKMGNLEGKVDKLEGKVGKLEGRIDNLEKGQEEIKSDLRALSQTVAKIEVEHGQKLQILLDVVTSQPQKFKSTEERLDKHENRLNKHADEIYYLNSKVQAF